MLRKRSKRLRRRFSFRTPKNIFREKKGYFIFIPFFLVKWEHTNQRVVRLLCSNGVFFFFASTLPLEELKEFEESLAAA